MANDVKEDSTTSATGNIPSGELRFLSGGGEMGAHMRAKDWAATPVGHPSTWSQSLRTVVRMMLDSRYAMWMGWGPDLTFFYNDAYARDTLGKKHPWALGRPAREVWAEIWADIGPRIDRVLSTGQATWDEGLQLFLERSGYSEETYHTFSYSPLYDDSGQISGMFCVVTEETQRVISERRVALLRDLAAALNTTKSEKDVFAAIDRCLLADGRDLPFSLTYLFSGQEEAPRLVLRTGVRAGEPAQDANGWPLSAVMSGASAVTMNQLPAPFDHVRAGPWSRPSVQAVLVPIAQQGQSRPAGVFVAGINPHRKLDEGYLGFLNLFVGQIASALANAHAYEEERRRAEALAELDRAKTVFFSNVSHEFRTPLTLMLGPLEDTLNGVNGPLPQRTANELAVVHRNGLRLLKLVNTLLDFSRIEAGRVQAIYDPTDLSQYTAELASVFRSAIERAGMRLSVDCPPLGQPAYVDRGMWEKVVLNLLSNAFKFTLQGEIEVKVRQTDGQAELIVRDTGSGIPEQELPRLFERFHRVEGTRGRTHEGTGIGLALVQELIKLHGGNVRVESRVGQGTTFFVRIPLGSSHLPQDRVGSVRDGASGSLTPQAFAFEAERWLPDTVERAAEVGELPAAAPSAGPRPRIVLADDNADMRQYVQRLLSAEYDVTAVNDGRAALDAVHQRHPDLVLSDVMMPNHSGFGLLRELRESSETANIPVILLSARAGEEATLEGLSAGADDYLIKPFSARDLMGRVAAVLERKRFQRELAAADDRLRMALDAAKMAAWEWDLAEDQINFSDTVAQVFGLRPGTTLRSSKDGKSLLHPADADRHFAKLKDAIDGRCSFHSRFRIIRPVDGSVAWLEERGTARKDESTGRVRVVGVVMDVTETMRAQEERERLLEREQAARSDAERAGRLKDDFLTTLSHELRTPLNAILGWSHLLQQGRADAATIGEGLSVIARNARAQTQLIEDLLDMSRITSGKLRLEVERVELSDVIDAAVESVRPAADAREIRLVKVLDSVGTIVSGDPHRLQQVVWNLLSNAIKFTPKGGRVKLVLERINSHVELSVIDNGMGIDPAFLPHLFERFRQADSSTRRAYGGLGLGLAIVKQLVEMHGGTVEARSGGEGTGATFVVSLPVAVAGGKKIDRQRRTLSASDGQDSAPISLDGITVLVVDDEPDARGLIQHILSDCHAKVATAASVEEAVQLFQAQRPDVIVSDIGMPDQDGYDLMRAIRALPREEGGQTPAAALTAYARPLDRRQALLAGYQSHIVKPADPEELVTVVASLCGRLGHGARTR